MVESSGLLNRRRVKSSTGGSNPPLSARLNCVRTGHIGNRLFPRHRPRHLWGSRPVMGARLDPELGRKVPIKGRMIPMSLNIKNEEAHKLARQLAKLTGESMTEAVTEAVRERLGKIRREKEGRLSDRLLQIGRDCAAHLKEPFRSVDHGEFLYDDKGLPK